MSRYLLPVATVLCASSFLLPAPAFALEFGVVFTEESQYTTNANRTEDDELEEWIHTPGVDLTATHAGPAYDLDINYNLSREIHQDDLFDDENISTGTASMRCRAIPERLELLVDHTRSQTAIRAIESLTPDNRQESSATRAGPLVRFNTFGSDEIQLQYMWGDRSREDTPTDAITHTTNARYVMALSTTNDLTFEATNHQVQFDNAAIPDIEYNVGQVIWDRTSNVTELSVAAGYSEAERTQGRDDVDAFIFNLDARWQARPATTLIAQARHDLRDQPEGLISGDLARDVPTGVSSDLGEVFTNTLFEVGLEQSLGARTQLELMVGYEEEEYEDVGRDRESNTFSATLNRRLSPDLSLRLNARATTDEYIDEDDESDTLAAGIDLDWRVGRRLGLGFGIRYEERDSDSGFESRNYEEWVALIRFTYEAVAIDRRR